MATINSTQRDAFLADLTADQMAAFETLEKLLSNKQDDFAWHHAVGRCVQTICPREADAKHIAHGDKLVETLAKLLECSPAPLRKNLRFVREYGPSEVKRLEKLRAKGLTWTHLTHAFTERNQAKRWKLLEQAADADKVWNSDRLKYEIRHRVVSSHPNSGRPPRKAAEDCDEVELKRLQQLSQKWLNYHDHIWAGDKPDTVLTRLRELPLRKRKALGALLADTESMLGRLSGAARQLQESLAKLNK